VPREQIVRRLVYDNYVSPNIDVAGMLHAERLLQLELEDELADMDDAERERVIARWIDHAWKTAAREYAARRSQPRWPIQRVDPEATEPRARQLDLPQSSA